MESELTKYDVTARDLARGRNLQIATVAAPVILTLVPLIISIVLMFGFGVTPPLAITMLVAGAVITGLGLLLGLGLSGYFFYRRVGWTKEMREKIAVDGIKAEEVDWFTNEMTPAERRALRDITRSDLLLADAYRETLASRLTATRIAKASRRELSLAKQRRSKIRKLRSDRAREFGAQLQEDENRIAAINDEASAMRSEAETRLQMIEAAAIRGRGLADSELVLKKLSARADNLPIALEEAKLSEDIKREIEAELEAADLEDDDGEKEPQRPFERLN